VLTSIPCCMLHDLQMTIYRNRAEMSDLNTRMMQEQHKGEQQASIIQQLNDQLQDAFKELKVRLVKLTVNK